MKKILMPLLVGAICGFAGCLSQDVGTGAPVKDVTVIVAPGYTFEKAVISAANRRHWLAVKESDTNFRLTIRQRENVCAVRVVDQGNGSFSILPIESNITVRKYDAWVDALRREIVMRAMSAK